MENNQITFYIVDPDMQRRNALSRALSNTGHAVPLEDLSELGKVSAACPCLLVYDEKAQVASALSEVASSDVSMPVMAYSTASDPERLYELLDEGAAGYFVYDTGSPDPSAQIERLINRNAKVQRARQRRQTAIRKLQNLTDREHEVLRAVSNGNSNKAIALQLNISPRTVEIHRKNMIEKLGVSSSISAVRVVLEAEI